MTGDEWALELVGGPRDGELLAVPGPTVNSVELLGYADPITIAAHLDLLPAKPVMVRYVASDPWEDTSTGHVRKALFQRPAGS